MRKPFHVQDPQLAKPHVATLKPSATSAPSPFRVAKTSQGVALSHTSGLATWRELPSTDLALLFDVPFYHEQLDATEDVPSDVVAHYASFGAALRLSPNRLFEPYFYLEQRKDLADVTDPLLHYLSQGWREGLQPHPMFEPVQDMPDQVVTGQGVGQAPLLATLRSNWLHQKSAERVRQTEPPEVGSTAWLRACSQVVLLAPLQRAIRRLVQVRPRYSSVATALETVFDLRFYSSQLRRAGIKAARLDLLMHYAEGGFQSGLKPHPMFDPLHYLERNADVAAAGIEPLLHYLLTGWSEPERTLHSVYTLPPYDAYQRRTTTPTNQITAYVTAAPGKRPVLSTGLAVDYYRRTHSEVDWVEVDPLLHYLSVGALRGDLPNPAFDPVFYAATIMTDRERARMSVLEHFDASPIPRPGTFALFDAAFYCSNYADLNYPGFDAVTHYLQYGVWEDRRCSAIRSIRYIYTLFPQHTFSDCPPIGVYLKQRANDRRRVVFVGHEATRTGAPGILLRLVQLFSNQRDVECVSIIDQDGPLIEEYARHSHVVVPRNHRLRFYSGEIDKAEIFAELDGIMGQLRDNPPVAVFCNCAEVRLYAEYFRQCSVPIIFLLHELAGLYPVTEMNLIAENSDCIVFPAKFVAEEFRRLVQVDEARCHIIPQGLLRDSFGDGPAEPRVSLFTRWKLNISPDTFIVLGCGTVDGRKGFDHFVETARKVRMLRPDRQVQFVWVGGRPHWRINDGAQWDTTAFWSSWDLAHHGLDSDVFVVPEVPDPEAFFMCADVFLLTSRADPFPCVVHEAMACGMPVIGFANTGGAPEAFLPDAGLLVGYPDTMAMAEAVLSLATDEPLRQRMGEIGRARVKSRYCFASYAEQLKELVRTFAPETWRSRDASEVVRSRRPKVYFTTPMWSLSGVGTHTETLVRYLNCQGFEAEILMTCGRYGPARPNGRFYEPATEVTPGTSYRVLQPDDLSDTARQAVVRDFLKANAPCVLVPNFDYVVGELARSLPPTIGILGIVHSDDAEHYNQCYQFGPFWDRIIAVSDLIASNVIAMNPVFAPKLEIIRYGLALPAPSELNDVVDAKIAQAQPIRLVYAGRFETFQKRIYDYVALAERLHVQGIDFRLELIGEGTELTAVRARLAPLIHAGLVSVPGRLGHAETLRRMRWAHAVLILSDFEGLPLCLLEALQSGCVPIAYAIRSGIPEVIDDGTNGFIVPIGDLDAVVGRVRLLQDDPTLRARLIDAALATLTKLGLTEKSMGERFISVLNEVFADIAAGNRQRRVSSYLEAITQATS